MAEKEREKGEDDEVGAAGEVCQFVQLEGRRDREENNLHTDRNDRAHGEVVLVQNIDRHWSSLIARPSAWWTIYESGIIN